MAKWLALVIGIMIMVFSVFILFFVIEFAKSGEMGLAIMFFLLFVLPLWITIVWIWQAAKYTVRRSEYMVKLTNEGIYEHIKYIDDNWEDERMVYFDQLQAIYLGREPFNIAKSFRHFLRMRIYWVWEKDNERYINSILVEDRRVFDEVLSRFPKEIPIRAFEYRAPVPPEAFDELITDSKPVEPTDGQPVILPYPAFKMVSITPPTWEPTVKRERREKRYKKLDRIANVLMGFCFFYIIYSVMAWMSAWTMVDGELKSEDSFFVPVPYFLVIIVFYCFRKEIPIKMLVVQLAWILSAYFIGGLGAVILLGMNVQFLIAVVFKGLMSILYLIVTFIVTKFMVLLIFLVPPLLIRVIKSAKKQNGIRLDGGA